MTARGPPNGRGEQDSLRPLFAVRVEIASLTLPSGSERTVPRQLGL